MSVSSTELKTSTETRLFTQNDLALWRSTAAGTRHTPESGLNTLVDCSAAAFEHMHLLAHSTFSNESKKKIEAYLESLQAQFKQLDYSQDMTLAAHYTICATLDDILRCAGYEGQFLQMFHNSRLEQEKFYSILDHITPKADQYLDLLELMYLCLRFGYKGQYRNTPFGLQQWSQLTENTYHLIAQIRGERSQVLSPELSILTQLKELPAPISSASKHAKQQHHFYISALLVFFILIIIAGFIFRQTYENTRATLNTYRVTTQFQPHEAQKSETAP